MYRQLVLAFFAIILLSVPARAVNVVITSGSATLIPFDPDTIMQFSGSGFGVSARGDGFGGSGFFACIRGCRAGEILALSGDTGFWGFTDLSGSVGVNGTVFVFVSKTSPTSPEVVGSGSISFAGGSVVVPFGNDAFVTLSTPFSVTNGSLTGSAIGGGFGLNFTGSGIATLTLRNLGNGQYTATGIVYLFQPVPEPATLILVTTGLVGVAIRYRNRLRR